MAKFVLKRILLLIPILLGTSFIVFSILYLTPADPARIMLGASAPQSALDQLREELGLNEPFLVQYGSYILGIVQGDFGVSYRTGQPVFDEIFARLPVTLMLAGMSIVLVTVVGISFGIIAAVRQHHAADSILTSLSLFLSSIPSFWLGLMMILFFALYLGLLPSHGVSSWSSYIMPVIALSLPCLAELTRMTRASMLETLGQDYIRTYRAKGLKEGKIIWRHALKNALMTVITVVGSNFGSLLGGAVVIETVFSLPGLGSLIVSSIRSKDVPEVMAGTLLIVFMFCIVLLVVDVAYAYIDPRVRTKYLGVGRRSRRARLVPAVEVPPARTAAATAVDGETPEGGDGR